MSDVQIPTDAADRIAAWQKVGSFNTPEWSARFREIHDAAPWLLALALEAIRLHGLLCVGPPDGDGRHFTNPDPANIGADYATLKKHFVARIANERKAEREKTLAAVVLVLDEMLSRDNLTTAMERVHERLGAAALPPRPHLSNEPCPLCLHPLRCHMFDGDGCDVVLPADDRCSCHFLDDALDEIAAGALRDELARLRPLAAEAERVRAWVERMASCSLGHADELRRVLGGK